MSPVNVLAVMDRAISDSNTPPRHAMPLREAREAVSMLIYAANKCLKSHPDSEPWDLLEDAVARCGGTP